MNDSPHSPAVVLLREHLGLVITIVPVTVAALRLIRVSGLDPSTLAVLLRTVDFVQLFLGSFLASIPVLIGWLVATYLAVVGDLLPRRRSIWRYRFAVASSTFGLFLLMFMTPVSLAAVIVIVLITWASRSAFTRWDKEQPWAKRREAERGNIRGQQRLLLYLAVILVFLPGNLWLPAEKITIDGSDAVVYVLESSDKDLTLLHEKGRNIETVEATRVTSRQFCTTRRSIWFRPFLTYLGDVAYLPPCPK